MPVNFLRHYYDIYRLLENERVLNFIGSAEYIVYKKHRFRTLDETNIYKNPAFTLPDFKVRKLYDDEFKNKPALYFGNQPRFENILERLQTHIHKL